MRDIRPAPKPKSGLPLPDEELLLEPTTPLERLPTPAPRLTGAKVGVSTIDVPIPEQKKQAPFTKSAVQAPTGKKTPLHSQKPSRSLGTPRVGQRERVIIAIFLILLGIVGALALLLFLPRAAITLVLRTAPLLVDESVTLATNQAAGTDTDIVPGTAFFREVTLEGTAPVTSTKVIGAKASGTVYLINRTVEPQSIKEQSRLEATDGTLFYMQKGVTIPAATGAPAVTTVEVIAAEPGEAGNLGDQKLNFAALDASSQSLLYAETREALTGGSGETVPTVTQADLLAAQHEAGSQARMRVEADIREELPNGWVILEESWTGQMIEFNTPVALEAQESQIPFQARVNVRVMGYEEAALEQRLRTALESRMQDEYMLFPGDISYSKNIGKIDWENSTAEVSARVTHTTIPKFSLLTLQGKLVGQTEAAAHEYLTGLPGVRSAQLELTPFWVHSIPRLTNRIIIELIPERQP